MQADAWDIGQVYAAPQGLGLREEATVGMTPDEARKRTKAFIRDYQAQPTVHTYREALLQNYNNRTYFLEIDLEHIKDYDSELHDVIVRKPNEYIPMMETGAKDALASLLGDAVSHLPTSIQILFVGDMAYTSIRAITADDVNRLVLVPGIVVTSARTRPKAVSVTLKCKNCGDERHLNLSSGLSTLHLPRTCSAMQQGSEGGGPHAAAKCPIDPYVIITDKSRFVDQQTLKLQEAPEAVPTGELPRHIQLAVERQLADKIAPGTRVAVFGIVSAFNNGGMGRGGSAVKTSYLRVVGMMIQEEGTGRAVSTFTPEEDDAFRTLAREAKFFDRLASSVAPSISGDYTTDIKKAILCLLMAGSRKLLPDGMRLRGDINVLMLGDPSTAKSQFLKFVEKVAPVGVYTSGKGSSAAGLTASVIKDKHGDFVLEGGAMVLADGGVVCIDEFDKMREEDRVAIHEAMEQQTISVAKAGITTILNSRSAVLAAANPVFGRYDDGKSAADNIDLLPTILSRFDLIFIVRDVRNEKRDQDIARHVMRVHINAEGGLDEAAGEIDMATMKKFISYARAKCAPRLSEEAARFLQSKYVEIRQEARGRDHDAREVRLASSEEHGVIPITVRQLEALVRITESIAKCSLSKEATVVHAEEALRLFRVSTLNAAQSGLSTLESNMTPDMIEIIKKIENRIHSLIPIGGTAATSRVKDTLMRAGFDESMINAALRVMERRDEITLTSERKVVRRNR